MELDECVLIPSGSKICLVGKTGSGKSTLLRQMCEEADEIFVEKPTSIYLVYQNEQSFFGPLQRTLTAKGIELVFIHRSVPREIKNLERKHLVLCVDDLNEQEDLAVVSNYFLRAARHNKITIIINFQSLFVNNDHFRAIMANADFIALFYMTKIAAQLKCFAHELFGEKAIADAFIKLYFKLTNTRNGCLILDLRQGITYPFRSSFSLAASKPVEFYKIANDNGGEPEEA